MRRHRSSKVCRTTRDKDAKVTEKAAVQAAIQLTGRAYTFQCLILIFLSRGCANDSWQAFGRHIRGRKINGC